MDAWDLLKIGKFSIQYVGCYSIVMASGARNWTWSFMQPVHSALVMPGAHLTKINSKWNTNAQGVENLIRWNILKAFSNFNWGQSLIKPKKVDFFFFQMLIYLGKVGKKDLYIISCINLGKCHSEWAVVRSLGEAALCTFCCSSKYMKFLVKLVVSKQHEITEEVWMQPCLFTSAF